MFSYGEFQAPAEGYRLTSDFPSTLMDSLSEFIGEHSDDVKVFTSRELNERALSAASGNSFIIGVGDQLVRFPVREIGSQADAVMMNDAYRSGNLVKLTYLLIPEKFRGELLEILDAAEKPDHNVQRIGITVIELGPAEDRELLMTFDIPESHAERVLELSEGNHGAAEALSELLKVGEEQFEAVAPQLGRGHHIWLKYSDEYGKDIALLIERYSKN